MRHFRVRNLAAQFILSNLKQTNLSLIQKVTSEHTCSLKYNIMHECTAVVSTAT